MKDILEGIATLALFFVACVAGSWLWHYAQDIGAVEELSATIAPVFAPEARAAIEARTLRRTGIHETAEPACDETAFQMRMPNNANTYMIPSSDVGDSLRAGWTVTPQCIAVLGYAPARRILSDDEL